jgi:hypothetical protein
MPNSAEMKRACAMAFPFATPFGQNIHAARL